MDPKEKEAIELMADGDKLAKSSRGFFSSLLGGSSKLEDACEKYVRAGNLFKASLKMLYFLYHKLYCCIFNKGILTI